MELPTTVKIVFLLVAAAHASLALSRVPWMKSISPRAVCTAPAEIICSIDCTQVQLCLGDGSGGFHPQVVADCEDGLMCSAEQGTCVAPGDTECQPPTTFTCHDVGSFPDPYDCQKYHVCSQVGASSISITCPGTSAYNPMRADCSLTTADRVCVEGPITPCEKLGDMGAVQENPSIYYICMMADGKLIPHLYRCPGNQIFDTSAASCVDPSTIPTTTTPTTTTPTTTKTTTTTPTTTTPTTTTSTTTPTTTTAISTTAIPTTTTPTTTTPTTTTTTTLTTTTPTTTTSTTTTPTTTTPTTMTTTPTSTKLTTKTPTTTTASTTTPTTTLTTMTTTTTPTTTYMTPTTMTLTTPTTTTSMTMTPTTTTTPMTTTPMTMTSTTTPTTTTLATTTPTTSTTPTPPTPTPPTMTPPTTTLPTTTPPTTPTPTSTLTTTSPTTMTMTPPTMTPPTTTPPTTTTTMTTTQAPTTLTLPSSPGGTCTTQLEIAIDPYDCTKYYECVGFVWVHMTCIHGYHFDPTQGICIEGTCNLHYH